MRPPHHAALAAIVGHRTLRGRIDSSLATLGNQLSSIDPSSMAYRNLSSAMFRPHSTTATF
jgi:hypothetical protein